MPEIIDCVFVSDEPYTEPGRRDWTPSECYRFCLEVHSYAERAAEFGFADHEMPKPLIHVHRATEVAYRSESFDDLEDFLSHIEWSSVLVEETIEALQVIGADEHAHFVATVHDYLKDLGYKIGPNMDGIRDVIGKAFAEHLSADALQKRYGDFGVDDEGDDLDRRWYSICLQAVRYMDGWTNIKRIPDGSHNQVELEKYFQSRLEFARRSAMEAGDALPNVVSVKDAEAFVTASINGGIAAVQAMLAAGVDVNARMKGGSASLTAGATALMTAAAQGHLEVVKVLLAAKAKVNTRRTKYGETALIFAAERGHLDVVQALLSAKAKIETKTIDGETALIVAAGKRDPGVVQTLISVGADVNAKTKRGTTALSSACRRDVDQAMISGAPVDQSDHIEVARALLAAGADANPADSEGWTPLIHASRAGLSEVVKDLLAAGADVNARTGHGDTALIMALSWKRAEIARLLLAAKADVHAATKSGQTALLHASSCGYTDVVQALLDAGAEVNPKDGRGFSALMAAAGSGRLEVVELLFAARADVNAMTEQGRTALFQAAMNGHLDVVKALVAANADIDVKNADGETALTVAGQKGRHQVAEFLRATQSAGAGNSWVERLLRWRPSKP